MITTCAVLALPPAWRKDELVMVRATEAVRLCREGGFAEVPRSLARSLLGGLGRRDAVGVRAFLSRLRLTGAPLAGLDDIELLAVLHTLLSMREVIVLRACAAAGVGQDKALAEQRRLIREITSQTRGRLNHEGRQYRLVVGDDLGKLPDRDAFEVVHQADAKRVLEGVAHQLGQGTTGLPALLTQARGQLTRDWRPPFSPDGLVLLRRIIVRPGYKSAVEPAITPSALKKLKDDGWIEIVFVDAGMEPIADADYSVKLADGGAKTGKTDKKGSARFEGIMPGECQVSFPKADGPVALV
jgi:hypothetical protein